MRSTVCIVQIPSSSNLLICVVCHFQKCTNLPVCEKRDISDFILGVTVRLSKYPILIEAILKSTKGNVSVAKQDVTVALKTY